MEKKEYELKFDYMQESDLKDVLYIDRNSFRTPWSINAFRREIMSKYDTSHFLVARYKRKTIAFIGFTYAANEAHILTFAVHPKFRRRGVGAQLMEYTLDLAKSLGAEKITLDVRVSNLPAQSLYKKFGFKIVSIRRKFYTDTGEDAYVMWIPNLGDLEC